MSDYRVDTQVNFDEMNNRVRFEIRRTINALTGRLHRTVNRNLLSGDPYLKADTGRLHQSTFGKVEEGKDFIEGTVGAGGANVRYLFTHEFGLHGTLGVKAHLRTIKQAFGRSISPKQVAIKAHSRVVNFRERRMLRDALDEVGKIVPKNIDAAIERGLADE
ncbi:hypothetical protein ACJOY7_11140 [Acinetobacter baumannii]